jgi:hypothetical protein
MYKTILSFYKKHIIKCNIFGTLVIRNLILEPYEVNYKLYPDNDTFCEIYITNFLLFHLVELDYQSSNLKHRYDSHIYFYPVKLNIINNINIKYWDKVDDKISSMPFVPGNPQITFY